MQRTCLGPFTSYFIFLNMSLDYTCEGRKQNNAETWLCCIWYIYLQNDNYCQCQTIGYCKLIIANTNSIFSMQMYLMNILSGDISRQGHPLRSTFLYIYTEQKKKVPIAHFELSMLKYPVLYSVFQFRVYTWRMFQLHRL